jgi:hypothetical protein
MHARGGKSMCKAESRIVVGVQHTHQAAYTASPLLKSSLNHSWMASSTYADRCGLYCCCTTADGQERERVPLAGPQCVNMQSVSSASAWDVLQLWQGERGRRN